MPWNQADEITKLIDNQDGSKRREKIDTKPILFKYRKSLVRLDVEMSMQQALKPVLVQSLEKKR